MRLRPTPPGARNEPPPTDDANGWITGAIPDGMFTEPPEIVVDRDEIVVRGRLSTPELAPTATAADRAAAETGRINQHREDTRDQRIRIALQIEHRYRRKVSWGARCGDTDELFTHLSAPVMTRLRQPERQTLDTLVDAGVARSRSDALAWCVRLVGEHTEDWLTDLRTAMASVDELRRQGPTA
jgi:hypothetical protein